MTREFIYMPTFEKQWKASGLADRDLRELEIFLSFNPNAGRVIQGTGGLRKLRWSVPGSGKSGGVRILYIDFTVFEQTYLITCFRKSRKENLNDAEKNSIKSTIEQIRTNIRRNRGEL